MATPVEPFYQLKCSCNQYPWGKQGRNSLSARLCAKTPGWDGDGPGTNFAIDDSKAYAEMWMGTYPVLPSYVAATGEDLQAVLDRHPDELLGDSAARFGHSKLPYLPKVLSIAKALPLQVHPNKDFASKMHERDPSAFTDANHKPEIALALSKFEAFCGFKPLEDIAAVLRLDALKPLLGDQDYSAGLTNERLREAVRAILLAPDDAIRSSYDALAALPASSFPGAANAPIPSLAPRLTADFAPSDPGVLVALLTMNYLVLQPGEALYIPADGIHAYLSGDIIECMARSDNVLNTGFCPRADRDTIEQFCGVLTFSPHSPRQCMLPSAPYQRGGMGKTRVFAPPLSEFNVLETQLGGGEREALSATGPAILLATRGAATVGAGGKSFDLEEGHVYFVAQGVGLDVKAEDEGLLMHIAYTE